MNLQVVPLVPSMLDALMALSIAANWNQCEADWRAMLELGHGWGVAIDGGPAPARLAASTVALPYEDRFAWISMVLVLPAWRERGLAGALLEVALDDLSARGLVAVLDATPAGHPVYARQGFVDAGGIGRWRRVGGELRSRRREVPMPLRPGARLRPLRESDWPAIADLDAPAFGANRLPLLRQLARRLPAAAWVLEEGGEVRAFLLGRDGRTALQLGPLVAGDESDAIALLAAALEAIGRRVIGEQPSLIVDLRDTHPELRGWLEAAGFAFERPFTRMVRGALKAPGDPRSVVLVAGPELG